MHIDEVEFTIFDTETTGLNFASGDRIVEIAGVRFKGQKIIANFGSLINSRYPISEAAFAVNKITPQMLKTSPAIEEVLPGFLKFTQGSCLGAYNLEFDLGFLNNELRLSGIPAPKDSSTFDILVMARKLLPGLERYALWFVAQKLGIKDSQQHRAYADVELAFEVFNRLRSILISKGVTDFKGFLQFSSTSFTTDKEKSVNKILFIQEAILKKSRLRISYLSVQDSQITQREVIPKEIRQDARYNYLVGFCCLKEEERTFRIENILTLEIV